MPPLEIDSPEAEAIKKSESFVFNKLFHKNANPKKLVTREDPYHLHKSLGTLSIINFFYRYGYCYNTMGHLNYTGSKLDWITMFIHTFLACSSIIFRVPAHRLPAKPMVIYEEYRQHAMVFTLRCFFVYSVSILFPDAPTWVVPCVVAAHHLAADYITGIHGNGSTAVRANVENVSGFYQGVSKMYSFYQFLAIGSHVLPNDKLPDLAFNAIIAIASSAFMMTLYRKRIIRGTTHLVVYSFCLIVSAFHIIRLIGWTPTALCLGTFLIRINLPRAYSNKYVLWLAFILTMNYKETIVEFLNNSLAPYALSIPTMM